MAGKIDARLTELGIALPEAAAPAANYVPYVVHNGIVTVAGQITLDRGKATYLGRLGVDIDIPTGQAAARLCALNILAQLRNACGGDLDKVVRCIRLGGFVNSTPDFTDQPKVVNGASDLLVEVFGPEIGSHARAAVGVAALPLGVSVEVEGSFAIA